MDIKAFKMDGLGNDFVIIDNRQKITNLTKEQIIKICNRNFLGCDQLILIEKDKSADAFLKFYNSDGGESGACGNGTRCVADLISKELNNKSIILKTISGYLKSEILGNNIVTTEIGRAKTEWNEIPLSEKLDTRNLNIKISDKDNKEYLVNTFGKIKPMIDENGDKVRDNKLLSHMLMGIEASILVFIMEEEQKSFIMPQHDGWVSLVDWNTKTLEKIIKAKTIRLSENNQDLILKNGIAYSISDLEKLEVIEFTNSTIVNNHSEARAAISSAEIEKVTDSFIWSISLVMLIFISVFIALPISTINPRKGRYSRVLPALLLFSIYIGLLLSFKGEEESNMFSFSVIHIIFLLAALFLNFNSKRLA